MEVNKILSADILDILFDGRNKEYGAYDLRKTYNKRIQISLGGMILICALFLVGSLVANSTKKGKSEIVVADMSLENVKKEEKKPEPPPPLPGGLPRARGIARQTLRKPPYLPGRQRVGYQAVRNEAARRL